MPAFVLVSEFDYYAVCAALGVREPDRWAVDYAQVVKWLIFFRVRHALTQPSGPGA